MMYQTIYLESNEHTRKLTDRLVSKGYFFICQMSRRYPGRIVSFSSTIDFEKEKKLFSGINYKLTENPSNIPTKPYQLSEV